VSHWCLRLSAALLGIMCLAIPARSEEKEISILRGEIRGDAEMSLAGYQVELYDLLYHRDALRTDVHADGTFEFRSIPAGEYTARIITLQGDIVYQESVRVRSTADPVFLRLPPSVRTSTASATVSMRQLQHPPAAKAMRAFVSAQKFSESGDFVRAAMELEKAIQISPESADAYVNLATQHIRLGKYEQAVGELQHAIQIGGPRALPFCNLSYAQAKLERRADAIESARQALKLDNSYAPAHLILGALLATDPGTVSEAIPHLERAAESLPAARITLERVQHALSQ